MVRPGRDQFCDGLGVDETYIGGSGKRGCGSKRKEVAVIAVEVYSPKGFGRVRMRRIPGVFGDILCLSSVTLPKRARIFLPMDGAATTNCLGAVTDIRELFCPIPETRPT